MKDKLAGALMVLFAAMSYGVLTNIAITAYRFGYTVGQVTVLQSFFGMIILWGFYLLSRVFHRYRPKKKLPTQAKLTQTKSIKHLKLEYVKVILAGICPGTVGILYFACVKYIPASIAVILLMQYLWINILIDFLVFKHKPTRLQIYSVIVIILASVFATGLIHFNITTEPNANEHYNYVIGYTLGILGAFANCLFLIVADRVGNQFPALKKSALMTTGSLITKLIIFPPLFIFTLPFSETLYLFGVVLALLGTVIPTYLYAVGTPKAGLAISTILSGFELPVTVCVSYFYLKEQVTLSQWIGVMVIILAMTVANIKIKHRKNRIVQSKSL